VTPGFWAGRRVLVTGHTGFKGAWLCLWLDRLGAETYGYALEPPTQPSLYDLANVDDVVRSTTGDLRDFSHLHHTIDRTRPEILIHMAAQSRVLLSYEDPIGTYSTNVLGTVHVLEALRQAGRPCAVVNVTTDKVYDNKGLTRGYTEGDELGGHDPYSSSKAGAELVARAYRESFFPVAAASSLVTIASARAGNVIGGGDWTPDQLVPDAIAALAQGRPVTLRRPEAVRPWQHVLDCLSGYLALAEKLRSDAAGYSGEWNFGPPESDCVAVVDVVEGLAARMGVQSAWERDERAHAPEESVLQLDSRKAAQLLGWQPALPLSVALDWVADWYRALSGGGDAAALCHAQLAAYEALRAEAGAREAALPS